MFQKYISSLVLLVLYSSYFSFKNCDYVILSGAKRKEERWDPAVTENIQTTGIDILYINSASKSNYSLALIV